MGTKGKARRLVRRGRTGARRSCVGLDGPRALIFASAVVVLPACLDVIGDVDVDRRGDSISIGPIKSIDDPFACGDAGIASGACVTTCVPGESRCREALLQHCNDRGDGWELTEQCASSALCDRDSAQCLPPACAIRQHLCTEPGELLVCKADRTGFEHKEQCRSAGHCSAASGRERCELTACRAGRQRCNGAQIEQCRVDRSGFDVVGEPCASASLCREGDSELARCEAPACTPGQYLCDGARLLRCADSADAFLEIRRCDTPELCNVSAQRCEVPACGPLEQRCVGNVLLRCNASQTALAEVETCASALLCDPAAPRCLTTPVVTPPDPPVLGTAPYNFVDASGTAALGLGPLTLTLPAEWTDIDRRAWTNAAGETLGPQLIASTNATRFASSFDIPGVYFAATARAPLDVASRLLEFDMSQRCTRGASAAYDDGVYSGTSQIWTNCAATSATNVVVVAVPDDRSFVTIGIVTMLAERDQEARDEIWDSFLVLSPAP